MDFFRRGRQDGGRFEAGIDLALRRMLASPKFVFRVERDPAGRGAGPVVSAARPRAGVAAVVLPVEQHPDDELLDLAAARAGCARRRRSSGRCGGCWRDPKAQALVDNFAGQWLQLRNLRNKQPNSHEFPDFDDNLRHALQTETELFFALDHARGPQRRST